VNPVRLTWAARAALVCSLLLTACGGADAPPAGAAADGPVNPVTAMQRGLEAMTVIYDDIADAIDSVEDEDTANAAAQRLSSEIVPQARSVAAGMIAAMSSAGQFSDDEIAAWESEVDTSLFQRVEDAHETAVYRMSDALDQITFRAHLITPELQAALQEFGETMMAMERGMADALLALD
jgi:hypothetical protein